MRQSAAKEKHMQAYQNMRVMSGSCTSTPARKRGSQLGVEQSEPPAKSQPVVVISDDEGELVVLN